MRKVREWRQVVPGRRLFLGPFIGVWAPEWPLWSVGWVWRR